MKKLNSEEIHEALLGILIEFDRVCRENGLRYTLSYGTLLGAVRHKGFIPWDDDVDVSMPRPDYEKLILLVRERNVLKKHFQLSKDRGTGTYYPFLKLMDDRYPIKCPNHVEVPFLYLDIFPVDGLPEDEREIEKIYRKEKFWVYSSGICQWYTMDRWWGFIAYVIGFWFYLGTKLFIGAKRSVRKMNAYASRYPFESSPKSGQHNFGFAREAIAREVYEEYCEVEFEGRKFFAVKEWDALLTKTFGDYMQLPPEKKRRSRHCMKVYRAVEEERDD